MVKVVMVVKTKTKERKMIFIFFDLFVTTLTTLTTNVHFGREWGWSRFRALVTMGTARPTSEMAGFCNFAWISEFSVKQTSPRGFQRTEPVRSQLHAKTARYLPPDPQMNLPLPTPSPT